MCVPRKITLLVLCFALSVFAFSDLSPASAAGEGETCGTIAGIQCDDGLWCEHEIGLCGAADAGGKCIETPGPCAHQLIPDCGCDGKEYSMACERREVRVQENKRDACPMP